MNTFWWQLTLCHPALYDICSYLTSSKINMIISLPDWSTYNVHNIINMTCFRSVSYNVNKHCCKKLTFTTPSSISRTNVNTYLNIFSLLPLTKNMHFPKHHMYIPCKAFVFFLYSSCTECHKYSLVISWYIIKLSLFCCLAELCGDNEQGPGTTGQPST